jgi:hypothetical protein
MEVASDKTAVSDREWNPLVILVLVANFAWVTLELCKTPDPIVKFAIWVVRMEEGAKCSSSSVPAAM